MAKSKIPDPLKRRHMLADQSGAAAARTAEAYLESGRSVEAIDFLARAEDTEKLDALRKEAVETGDVFLFRSVIRVTRVPAETAEWRTIAAVAEAAGKLLYAEDARRQAGRDGDSE